MWSSKALPLRVWLGFLCTNILTCRVNSLDICRFGNDAGCLFPCVCPHGCDKATGACLKGRRCPLDDPSTARLRRTGPGCIIGNVARGNYVRQNGTYQNREAGLAVDGVITANGQYCALPSSLPSNYTFWYVKLQDEHTVVSVTVFNINHDAYVRTGNFRIELKKSTNPMAYLCTQYQGIVPKGGYATIPCDTPVTGNFVIIRRTGGYQPWYMHLCEVMVHAYKPVVCPAQYYGEYCLLECSADCVRSTDNSSRYCDQSDGRCLDNCPRGFWGDRCKNACSGHCLDNGTLDVCSVVDGSCSQGCNEPHYGDQCHHNCSSGCRPVQGNNTCHRTTGDCSHGCREGLHGTHCNETCSSTCAILNDVHGCDGESGACSHGCHLPLYQTWHTKKYCNVSVEYVEWPDGHHISASNVTSESVVVEWSQVNDIPDAATQYYGYEIHAHPDAEGFTVNITLDVPADNEGSDYSTELTNLSPNTIYLISLGIYRQVSDGARETSKKRSKVETVTTLPVSATESTTSARTGSPSLTAPIAGAVVGGVLLIALALLIVVIVYRKRRQSRVNMSLQTENNNSDLRDLSTTTAKKLPTEEPSDNPYEQVAEEIVIKEVGADNPSVEEQLKVGDKGEAYYEYPARKEIGSGTCIRMEDLEAYIGAKKYTEDGLKKEFNAIPNGELKPCNSAKSNENLELNRFKNIWAYDENRLIVDVEYCKKLSTDYINASCIQGYQDIKQRYVATQGPVPESICAFWVMVWQLKSHRIVMVSRLKEMAKTKCEQYWPETIGKEVLYGSITVTTTAYNRYADYNLTLLSIRYGKEIRTVKHLQYTSWLDKSVPGHAFPLVDFRRKLRSFDDEGTGPIIVHCSAGIGRTGTFIAMDYLMDQMKAEGKIDIAKLVTELRYERMNMVQTLAQYIFLYDAMLDIYKQGETSIPCARYKEKFLQLINENEYSNEAPLSEQFQVLCKMKEPRGLPDSCTALNTENKAKNRNPSLVPDDAHRIYLTTKCQDRNDYINAVFVNSFLPERPFIVTQHPLPETVVDFWSVVWDQKCHTILTLENPTSPETDTPEYWSYEKGEKRVFDKLEVQLDSVEESRKDPLDERHFTVTHSSSIRRRSTSIRHFLLTKWSTEDGVLEKQLILNLCLRLQMWQQENTEGNVIIQCRDGARRCGLLCAANYMIEKMKVDGEVDVFLAVRAVSVHRPQFVANMDEYRLLHDIALEYIGKNELYGNFH